MSLFNSTGLDALFTALTEGGDDDQASELIAGILPTLVDAPNQMKLLLAVKLFQIKSRDQWPLPHQFWAAYGFTRADCVSFNEWAKAWYRHCRDDGWDVPWQGKAGEALKLARVGEVVHTLLLKYPEHAAGAESSGLSGRGLFDACML